MNSRGSNLDDLEVLSGALHTKTFSHSPRRASFSSQPNNLCSISAKRRCHLQRLISSSEMRRASFALTLCSLASSMSALFSEQQGPSHPLLLECPVRPLRGRISEIAFQCARFPARSAVFSVPGSSGVFLQYLGFDTKTSHWPGSKCQRRRLHRNHP